MKLKMCCYPGCTELTHGEYYCQEHKAKREAIRREMAFKTATRYADYHDPRWIALSKKFRTEHPACQMCGETDGLQVHHIIPVRLSPSQFLDENNLVVLCESCHRIETQREIALRRETGWGSKK